MNISAIVKRAQKATADNAPAILTALGVTGLVTTAVLAAKGGIKANEVMREEGFRYTSDKSENSIELRRVVDLTWRCYLPAVATGALAISCIVAANRVSGRRAAALASAYSIAQEGFREYKDKVVEKLGEKKEQEVRDDIAKDRVLKNPPSSELFILDGTTNVVCGDAYSGRYFISNQNKIEKAVNECNAEIIKCDYVTLSELWSKLGLDPTSESDEVGWSTDSLIDVKYSWGPTSDGRPCMFVDFGPTMPIRGVYSPFR